MQKGEAKSKLEKYLDKFHTEMVDLDILNRTMEYIRNMSTSKNTELSKVHESHQILFFHIHQLILQDVVLRIFKLLDKKSKRNIYWYLEQVKTNLKEFKQAKNLTRNEINSQIKKIENLESQLSPLINWRMKRFAHIEDKYFDDINSLTKDFPLRFKGINDAISLFKMIVEEHNSNLLSCGTGWQENDLIGIDKVVQFLVERNRMFKGIEKKYGWSELKTIIENPLDFSEENL